MPNHLLGNLLVFSRALRASGVLVRPDGVADAIRALDAIGVAQRRDVRDALRSVLVSRHEDFLRFDSLFDRFWRPWGDTTLSLPQPMGAPARTRSTLRMLAPGTASPPAESLEQPAADGAINVRTYSQDEAWRRKDFSSFTAADIEQATAALARLSWNPGVRRTRRWIAGSGRVIDIRRLLRANRQYGHEPVVIPHRIRQVAPRPLILICDVSGSMEPYTRMLLLFAHAIAGSSRRVEVFVFSTRLTRVTRQFAASRLQAALAGVRETVTDFSGGTRIGEAIRTFNIDWRRRVMNRGPVVLLISDGWDLGDPELLAREMARLQRSAYRLVWLNPLLGSAGYEPLARGMRAALPFVDDFLPVHNLASLEALALQLNTLSSAHAARTRRGAA
jgi:uncharacterized protein with von Willebrand factor type A (vWA) domain